MTCVPAPAADRPGDAAAGRRHRPPSVVLLAVVALVTLTGCFGGTSSPDRPEQLKGAALAAEIDRLSDEIAALPHVTSVGLQYTDSITDGQTFRGGVSTDTDDQATLDQVLDGVVRILWSTKAFYPGAIDTAVISADGTRYADYRTLGAGSSQSILASELVERYGQPAFLAGGSG